MMADYRFDCRECTNTAYSQRFTDEFGFDAFYCLPTIMGEETIELHDMGGTKNGDYLTCPHFTTDDRQIAIYEAVSIYGG